MTKIDGPVVQAAASQGGLVRRDQLRGMGVSNDVLDRLRHQGLLRLLTRDVFVLVGTPITSTMNDQAALWQAGPTAALSHASAGLRWELPRLATGTVEVVVAHGGVRPDRTIGRVHVSRRLGPGEVTMLDGVRLTTPGRTMVDLASRCSSIPGGLPAPPSAPIVDRPGFLRQRAVSS